MHVVIIVEIGRVGVMIHAERTRKTPVNIRDDKWKIFHLRQVGLSRELEQKLLYVLFACLFVSISVHHAILLRLVIDCIISRIELITHSKFHQGQTRHDLHGKLFCLLNHTNAECKKVRRVVCFIIYYYHLTGFIYIIVTVKFYT